MALQYPYDVFDFREVFDLPNQLSDSANRFIELKSKNYNTLNESEKNELHILANELYDYLFTANDFNNLFRVNNNIQRFMKEDLVNYINALIDDIRKEANKSIDEINTKRSEIDEWWQRIKNNITLHGWFEFDNYIMLENVSYYTTDLRKNPIVEKIVFNTQTIATRTTTFGDNTSSERTVVYDLDDGSILYDKTLSSLFNSNDTIKETVANNL